MAELGFLQRHLLETRRWIIRHLPGRPAIGAGSSTHGRNLIVQIT